MQYVSTPPKTIRISSPYSNLQCLHCHAGARGFSDNPAHNAIMGSLTTNQISCLTCHDTIHNASEVGHLKMWVPGNAQTSSASASSSTAPGPAKAESGATAGPLKASAAGGATTAATQGKSIFASQGCGGCHGESGGGGSGPALTHVSSQYPPAKLAAVLKAPTAKMKAGGMVALTVNAADMTALVSYVTSLGGTSAGSAATPPASGASSSAPAKAKPGATAGPSRASAAGSAGAATTATQGKRIFDSQGCGGCHGESGGGGSGPALTHISSQYPPAKLTALLKAPTAKMKAAGMVALTVNAADGNALVSYLTSLGETSAASAAPAASGSSSPTTAKAEPAATAVPSKDASAAAPPASGSSSPTAAKAAPAATAASSKAPTGGSKEDATATQGKGVYDSHGCGGCHGESGGGGSGPALTNISSQYPPAKLTAVLQAPTDKMKAAGMVALSVNANDMKALVSYVSSLGGTSAASATTAPASATSSPAPAKAESAATAGLSKTESEGQATFKAHGCADCHGTNGIGGTAAASALAGTGKSFAPALLTTELQHPTAQMLQGGMPPVSLSADELKALVAYVVSISGAKSNPH